MFDNLVLSGSVQFIQDREATNSKGAKSSTHSVTSAPRMKYVIDPTNAAQAIITLEGGVKTVVKNSSSEAENDIVLTGKTGSIETIRDPEKGKDGLQKGLFSGSVGVDVAQTSILNDPNRTAEKPPKRQRFKATSERLVYTVAGNNPEKMPQIELLDNLNLKSWQEEEEGPEITGATKATLILNEKNEVASFRLASGGGAGVSTRIKPSKKKGAGLR